MVHILKWMPFLYYKYKFNYILISLEALNNIAILLYVFVCMYTVFVYVNMHADMNMYEVIH